MIGLALIETIKNERALSQSMVSRYKSFTINMIFVSIVFISFIGNQAVLSFYM